MGAIKCSRKKVPYIDILLGLSGDSAQLKYKTYKQCKEAMGFYQAGSYITALAAIIQNSDIDILYNVLGMWPKSLD